MVDVCGGHPRFVRNGTGNLLALQGCFCPRPSFSVVGETRDSIDIARDSTEIAKMD